MLKVQQYLSAHRVSNSILTLVNPDLILAAWLKEHPKVAKAIVFHGEHYDGDWTTWPDWLRTMLNDQFAVMLPWYGQHMPQPNPAPFPDPIPREIAGEWQYGFGLIMGKTRGEHVYLSYVANALAAEMTGAFPWSITGYSSDHLKLLFDMGQSAMYYAGPQTTTHPGYYFGDSSSRATPAHVVRFLKANNLVGVDARDTVARLFGWARILIHWYTEVPGQPPDATAFWGPDAPPIPVSMLMNGSTYTGPSGPKPGRYTMGCSGTSDFFRSVLRAVNIPVEVRYTPCQHATPVFPTIHRALSHGDDPYDGLGAVTSFPGWPVPTLEEYLITTSQWDQWFGPGIDSDTCLKNVGRHIADLAIKYQSDYLLTRYCQDAAANVDHASGKVFEILGYFYTLVDLEAMHLWDKLAAKAAATGFCNQP